MKWAVRGLIPIYSLLLLVATARAWVKYNAETAAIFFVFGLAFALVLGRVWFYVSAMMPGSRSAFEGGDDRR